MPPCAWREWDKREKMRARSRGKIGKTYPWPNQLCPDTKNGDRVTCEYLSRGGVRVRPPGLGVRHRASCKKKKKNFAPDQKEGVGRGESSRSHMLPPDVRAFFLTMARHRGKCAYGEGASSNVAFYHHRSTLCRPCVLPPNPPPLIRVTECGSFPPFLFGYPPTTRPSRGP